MIRTLKNVRTFGLYQRMNPPDDDAVERKLLIQAIIFVALVLLALVLFFVFGDDPVPVLDAQPLSLRTTP